MTNIVLKALTIVVVWALGMGSTASAQTAAPAKARATSSNCFQAGSEKVAAQELGSAGKPPATQVEACPETVNVVGSLRPPTTYASLFSTTSTAASTMQTGPGAPPAAGSDAAALAKKLSNPVASLISVPFQSNFDFKMGPSDDGFRYTMNFQPVIPITLNPNWNLISRTIVPIIHQNDVAGTSDQTGLGDIVQSFFFSPSKTEPFIWGFGPVLLLPSATNDVLGAEKFGIGPTLVILKQQKGWTYGALLNHIWAVAGKDSRADVNATFLQPFLSYTTRTAWTFTVNTESTYDWTGEQWSVPVNFQVAKLVRFGKQPVSFAAGPRYWANSPSGGPEGLGLRFAVTLLFPK